MDDLWARIGLVAAALSVAGLASLILRARARGPARIVAGMLDDGIHFFSSSACSTCLQARRALDEGLGKGAYTEHKWEEEPALFAELEIDAVPASLTVVDGSGVLYPGQPDDFLASR